jgi:hypothetical protein
MVKFIGICDIIDWQELLNSLEKKDPGYIGPRHDVGMDVPGIEEVGRPLREAGYKTAQEGGNMRWDMLLVEQHFKKEIAEKFCEFVGMDSYINCWISRVNPGDVAPWHWDITDDEETLNAKKSLRRFHCHVSGPENGHTIIVDDVCLYKQPQGAVWEWSSRKSWHAGANAGLVPKYLFNIWG